MQNGDKIREINTKVIAVLQEEFLQYIEKVKAQLKP